MWKSELLPSIHDSIKIEIQPIKQNMAVLNKRCDEIEKSQDFVTKRFDDIVTTMQQSQKRIESLETKVNQMVFSLSGLTTRTDEHDAVLDDTQQYLRRDCLEFVGIPDLGPNDDPKVLIKEVCSYLKVDVKDSDISTVHRLKDTKYAKHRIIAKFTRRETKDKIYEKKRTLKGKTSSILPLITSQQAQGNVKITNMPKIFINESLTKTRRKLFGMAYKFAKQNGWKHTWTVNGKIYLKQDDNSQSYSFSTIQESNDFQY